MRSPRTLFTTLAITLALAACHGDTKKECGEFADFSNQLGKPINEAAPEAQKRAAQTGEAWAELYRKMSKAAQQISALPPRFKDPKVRAYEDRLKATYAKMVPVFDAYATAWQANDKDGVAAASKSEFAIMAERKAIADDWMQNCHE